MMKYEKIIAFVVFSLLVFLAGLRFGEAEACEIYSCEPKPMFEYQTGTD